MFAALGLPLLAPALPSMEVQPATAPAWLNETLRPDWRMTPLRDVLAALGKRIGNPVATSPGIDALLDRPVAFSDERKLPLRAVVETLEASQSLHATVEALRLTVETPAERRARSRRAVDLDLRSYGLFFQAPDFPALYVGYHAGSGGGAQGLFGGLYAPDPTRNQPTAQSQDIVDWLSTLAGQSVNLGADAHLHLLATEKEETALREALATRFAERMRQAAHVAWSGSLPATAAFPHGVVSEAEATALAARLDDRSGLSVRGHLGQRVHATELQQRTHVGDFDIVGGHHDPRVDVLNLGRIFDLRVLRGSETTRLSYGFAWVGLISNDEATIQVPASGGDVTHTREVTASTPASAGNPGEPGDVRETTTQTPAALGRTVRMHLPHIWQWQPQGEVHLGKGQALVLTAPHPHTQPGTAPRQLVLIIQETP